MTAELARAGGIGGGAAAFVAVIASQFPGASDAGQEVLVAAILTGTAVVAVVLWSRRHRSH